MWKVGTAGYGNGDHKVEFAIESTGPVTIYWGDGQKTENATTGTHSHTYTSAGDKKIVIAGPLTRFYNPNVSGYASEEFFGKLISVTDWGEINWKSMEFMFAYANKLNQFPMNAPHLTGVTNMHQAFAFAKSFNQPLNSWDVSNVKDMRYVFSQATSFDQPLNSWNVSKVTNMQGMFNGSAFNHDINNWNVSKVTDMSMMFANTPNFDKPLHSWRLDSAIKLNHMFA